MSTTPYAVTFPQLAIDTIASFQSVPQDVTTLIDKFSTYQLSFHNQIVARLLPTGFEHIIPRFSCCGERFTVIIEEPRVFIFDIYHNFISHFTFNPYVAQVCIDNNRDLIFLLHAETDNISQPLFISSFDTRGKKITSFSLKKSKSFFGLTIMKVSADGSIVLKTSDNFSGSEFSIDVWSIHGQFIRSVHFPKHAEDFDVGPNCEIVFCESEHHEEIFGNREDRNNEHLWKTNKFGEVMLKLSIDFQSAGIFCDSKGNIICFDKSAMFVFSSNGIFMGKIPVSIDLFRYNPSMIVSDNGKISICVGTILYG